MAQNSLFNTEPSSAMPLPCVYNNFNYFVNTKWWIIKPSLAVSDILRDEEKISQSYHALIVSSISPPTVSDNMPATVTGGCQYLGYKYFR